MPAEARGWGYLFDRSMELFADCLPLVLLDRARVVGSLFFSTIEQDVVIIPATSETVLGGL
jgi:hypothetical protein